MRRLVWVGLGLLAAACVPSAQASGSIEASLLAKINAGRSSPLVAHTGLRAAARGHSHTMSSRGSLTHSGARARISGAAGDPAEPGGGSDRGYTGNWCENVAFVTGGSASGVASKIYSGWRNSPGHNRCMNDPKMNVAGVGVFFDGETWWATLEAMHDSTPPDGSAPAAPDPTPEPVAPTPSPTSEPTPTATETVIALEAEPEAIGGEAQPTGSLGWPEVAGVVLAAAVAVAALTFGARRLSRRASGSGTT